MLPPHSPGAPDDAPDLVPSQIGAVGTIYLAWQLEALRVFDVADRLLELATRGMLPLGSGPAAATLTDYAFDPDQLSAAERRHLYARTFGAAGSAIAEGEINRDFDRLWLRFVRAVAQSAGAPAAEVGNAARALALNLSRHGAERALEEARHLHRTLEHLLHLLQAPEVTRAFDARSMWDVIERVNRQHFGGAVDTARARALAQSGSHIISWLAAHAADLDRAPDADLVATVEQWLAARGGALETIEPVPPAAPAALPVRLPTLSPAIMRELAWIESDARLHAGVCAYFTGPADEAKTLAAQVLASRLGRELYRIDLAALASPHAGETEQTLERVLAQARETDAVLLLDEADALFGRRSDVEDPHELLHRIEAHAGLAILAGRERQAPDGAPLHRLRYVIDFES